MENNIHHDKRFHSWGFQPFLDKRFDVCEIENAIYVHKYHPKELECIWTKFNENRLKPIINIKCHPETSSSDIYTVHAIQAEASEWYLAVIMILESFARIRITNMKKSANLVTVIYGINRKNFHRPFLMALIIIDAGLMLVMPYVQ